MAIDHGMWRIGAAPIKLQPVKLENENLLEELITKDISILNDEIFRKQYGIGDQKLNQTFELQARTEKWGHTVERLKQAWGLN